MLLGIHPLPTMLTHKRAWHVHAGPEFISEYEPIGVLLWHRLNPWPGKFHKLHVQPKKKKREKENEPIYGARLMKWCPDSLLEASLWEILCFLSFSHVWPISNSCWLYLQNRSRMITDNLLYPLFQVLITSCLDCGSSFLSGLFVSTLHLYSYQKDLMKNISQIHHF